MLNFLLTPFLTRIFVTAEYGVITELYAYVGFFIVLFTYGMETAYFRFSKERDAEGKTYSTGLISLIVSSILLTGLLVILAPAFADLINEQSYQKYIIYLALILGLDAIASLPFARLRFQERALRFATIRMVNIAINICLVLYFLWICPNYPEYAIFYNPDLGVAYIFIANLVASVVALLLLLPELRIKFDFNFGHFKKMFSYSWPFILIGFAYIINEMLDRILLRFLLEGDETFIKSQIGIYGACYKLAVFMTLFQQAFKYAAEPFFFKQHGKENAKVMYADLMKYFNYIASFIFLAILVNLNFIKHFIGPKFHDGLFIVPIILLANLFLGIYYNLSIWYKLTDKTKLGAVIPLIGAAITILFNLILIPKIGYAGAAWATLFCYSSICAISYFWGKRHYPVPYDIKRIGLSIILALVLLFVYRKLNLEFTQDGISILYNALYMLVFVLGVILLEGTTFLKLFKQKTNS